MMKAKNFRRRADDGDGDGDGAGAGHGDAALDAAAQAPTPQLRKDPASKPKKPPASAAPPSSKLLSFAEDEDNGPLDRSRTLTKKEKALPASSKPLVSFERDEMLPSDSSVSSSKTSKKKASAGFGALPGSSARLSAGKEKGTVLASNLQPQAGEYTKEKLLELQRNTIRLGGAKPPSSDSSKPLTEPVVVLKGLVKPPAVAHVENLETKMVSQSIDGKFGSIRLQDASFRSKDVESFRQDGVENKASAVESSRSNVEKGNDAENRLGLMGIGSGAEGGGVTHIPDAAAIAAAKAKRERLRQAQSAPDYIPVDSADFRGKSRESTGLDQEKDRNVSSDDEDGDSMVRIAMMGELPSGKKTRGGVFESVEEKFEERNGDYRRDDDEEEEEERRWEEEQLRKGFGKRVDDSTTNRPQSTQFVHGQDAMTYLPSNPLPRSAWGFGGQSMEAMTISQKAHVCFTTLQETLQRTKERYNWSQSELDRTEENLAASLHNISALEASLVTSSEKYVYMQKLRDYISVLCDFLKSKGPLIEELEEHMQKLQEDRAAAINERREADNADEMLVAESAIKAAMEALNRGSSTATATSLASAITYQSLTDDSSLTPQLDEFGRDLNLQKRMEAKQRAEARERRRTHSAKKKKGPTVLGQRDSSGDKVEGESSSDESESEEKAFQSGRTEILETAARVFGDASEEFSELAKVKETLETWKRNYFTTYRDAYVSLSAPSLFSPYVRIELLKWDPLHGEVDFNSMNWHTLLFDYGMPENGGDLSSEDADMDLVPKLVEKVVLPVLHHDIAHCWDILSTKSTKKAVSAVQEVLNYVPASSDALQDLLSAVRVQLTEAVSKIEVPTWSHQVISVVPQAGRIAAYKFGTSLRLLRNIGLWKDVLVMSLLEKLALDDLLSGKILPHLRHLLKTPYDAINRTERIISALSHAWISPNFTNRPKLEPLVEYIMNIGKAIEKRKGASAEDVAGLARRLKRMLVELNEYDRARSLSKTFQLKEAL